MIVFNGSVSFDFRNRLDHAKFGYDERLPEIGSSTKISFFYGSSLLGVLENSTPALSP
jgi:hypothetical protein